MNISISEENYIKAIYKLQQEYGKVTTNALAAKLNTRPASVTDMAGKLNAKNLIQHEKYYGIVLTPAGQKAALSIIRRHRLWECFLLEKLQFNWEEIHEVAEELEHVRSEKLTERLAAFLGYPATDPHGDPIPDATGKIGRISSFTLNNIQAQKKLEVTGVADQSSKLLRFLSEKGISLGTRIEITGRNDYDNSIEIKLRNKAPFIVSEQVAKNIYVKTYGKN
jgi:DtxR family transcriptional regulator, Mn-dependent transcriptional regulator